MELYGTTKEQLGWMAINSRRNAVLNPLAAYRDPITMDDYLSARPISSPLGLLDCDVPVDGSIAVVVSHRDYAPDCPNSAVGVEAIGGAFGSGGWFHRATSEDGLGQAAAHVVPDGSHPEDLDVAELYDGFTFLTIAWLEALGVCGDGEGGPFVDGASRIALDGELPLNTYGGQLSRAACTATGCCRRVPAAARPGRRGAASAPAGDAVVAAGVVPSPDACCSPADVQSGFRQGERQVVDDLAPAAAGA
jgi:acetyl-CoA acetyltransferase